MGLRSNALDPRQINAAHGVEPGPGDPAAFRLEPPQPLQLAFVGCPRHAHRALPYLCGALVGAVTDHVLSGRPLPPGDGADRLLELQIFPDRPGKPGALPPRRPEPPGTYALLRDGDGGLQPDQAGGRPGNADQQAGPTARRGDVRLLPLPGRPRGADRAGTALGHAREPALQSDAAEPTAVRRQCVDTDRAGLCDPAANHHQRLPARHRGRPAAAADVRLPRHAPGTAWIGRPPARRFDASQQAEWLLQRQL